MRVFIVLAVPLVVSGCVAAFAARGAANLMIDNRSPTDPPAGQVVATLEPSPVDGPLRCTRDASIYTCEGGGPGHARWCNDFIALNPGADGRNQIFDTFCLKREVPPDLAALRQAAAK
ncbi:MAG: hypothetical protein ACFBSD_09605 [Paracoccaceae bacterium]